MQCEALPTLSSGPIAVARITLNLSQKITLWDCRDLHFAEIWVINCRATSREAQQLRRPDPSTCARRRLVCRNASWHTAQLVPGRSRLWCKQAVNESAGDVRRFRGLEHARCKRLLVLKWKRQDAGEFQAWCRMATPTVRNW